MSPRRAFTLTELLMVIGIIALLASLLLPAIALVRQAADGTACMAHMRQLGIALQSYVDDNQGYIPPAAWRYADGQRVWQQHLIGYLDGMDDKEDVMGGPRMNVLYGCPVRKRAVWKDGSSWDVGYGYLPVIRHENGGWNYLTNIWGGYWRRERFFRLAEIDYAHGRAWIADSGTWYLPEKWYIAGNAGLQRHGGASNVLFMDGHIGRLKPYEGFYAGVYAPWTLL
ncbi:MAG: prepilin-type N-terminal cleavage/methylation domain-containing protein [Planctomycetota bacterium]|jgi:prepilin-type N-terminal cleavage/methylation domain-containing protein/prepilin-type processing-associated H-X9-DG protein|nr:prepilin-type N-terminal cleavage/methylation domain-containing protein [Planctomycetota bacterium]